MFDTPHRLHPAAIVINFGVYFVATVKAMFAPLIGIVFTGRKSSGEFMGLIIAAVAALIGAISLIGPVLNYFSTTFMIEDDALVISSGFVWRKRRTIPLARIQNVNVERTLWHRLLGAAAVKVETAAGGKTEGDLTALSVEDANKLQSVLLQHRGSQPVLEEETKPISLYELSTKQVLLAGALGNRALYIVASMAAVFQFDGFRQFLGPFLRYMDKLGPVTSILVGALTFVALFVIGWLLSIGISATRFFGFRIEKHDRGLLLSHGLITQFRTIVPVGRIQDVRVVEPILFRLLGYCEIYADTAGSFDNKDAASANKICPILPEENASQIGKLLMPGFEFETLSWNRVSKKTVGRHAWRHLIFYVVVFAYPLGRWLHWNALWVLPFLVLSCWLTALIAYRFAGYSWTNDILASRRGVFRKEAIVIPFDRLQHYTIHASLFQRWLGLTTVTAMSGSSGGHSISIVDVEAEAAERLRQTIGTSIQQHVGSRRGGL